MAQKDVVKGCKLFATRRRKRRRKFGELDEMHIGIASWRGHIAEPPILMTKTIARFGVNNVIAVLQNCSDSPNRNTERMEIFGVVAAQNTGERLSHGIGETLKHCAPCTRCRHRRNKYWAIDANTYPMLRAFFHRRRRRRKSDAAL
jgi:hypothetical protein